VPELNQEADGNFSSCIRKQCPELRQEAVCQLHHKAVCHSASEDSVPSCIRRQCAELHQRTVCRAASESGGQRAELQCVRSRRGTTRLATVAEQGEQGEQGGAVVEGGCMKVEMQCTPGKYWWREYRENREERS